MIPFERNESRFGLKGTYPSQADRWEIDPVKFVFIRKGEKLTLKADQFFLGETDLYLSPDLFKDIFGLDFTVNAYALMLSLKSERLTPVEEKLKRQSVRQRIKNEAPENILKEFPMSHPRRRALFAPGMLDYNVGINSSPGYSQLNYNLIGGMELLGGDIQGNLSGYQNKDFSDFSFNGLRWRYVFKGGLDALRNPIISDITAGQIGVLGPYGGSVRGLSISNTPIVPRRVLDVFAVEGFTVPDSEVELLIGNQLVDFTRADELGYYRFTTPLTYGTIRIGIRIYTPQGEVIMEDRQLQIPFTFVPRGMFNYSLQAGYQEDIFRDTVSSDIIGHGSFSYGLTNNITLRAGIDRRFDSLGVQYTPYGSASIRLFDQYLFNIDLLPNTFVRATASVFYANNTSLNVQFSDFQNVSFNPEFTTNRASREASANYYVPFNIFGRVSGFRAGIEQLWYNTGEDRRMNFDLNTRFGPIVTRLNYREELLIRPNRVINPQRLITGAFTYTIPRTPGVPVFVRGMFFRVQLRHDMKQLDATALGSFQFSQTVFKKGRLTLGFDRDFANKANLIQVALLYDFNAFRSSTQTSVRQKGPYAEPNFTQNFSGSFGADLRNGMILATNRDQVGRAGVTVRMFIDDNANGKFDKGEEIVPARAVRLDQSATMLQGKDGLLRITQLQSYWTYRLTVDQSALPDATLAPLVEKFSFVADPNRFKLIDIPLYRTGTIEGMVYRDRGAGMLDPQPGLRLKLARNGDHEGATTIRTYADGSFYAHGLIPGNYTLLVDSMQLKFMNVVQRPDTLKFTILPLPDGHWIDTLEIRLIPTPADTTKPKEDEPLTLAQLEYLLGERLKQTVTSFTEAQEHFYRANYSNALAMVDSSLTGFPTDFGLALKGSITYLLGDKKTARDLWSEARYRNPFIEVPDTNQVGFKPLQNSDLLANRNVPVIPPPAFDTIEYSFSLELMENFEAELGGALNAAVSAFVQAQELFYRRRYVEADAMIDTSLSIFVTDHALALKGSILYITGRQEEAWRIWAEARERNPLIALPETQILDRLIKPVARTSTNGQKKYSLN
ncbi:MAG: hypothetical protein Q8J69_03160 [Sphingobacteriaceae bacterium]|nr:hypothetical protein [Sphingobacteriaceae bacterium]